MKRVICTVLALSLAVSVAAVAGDEKKAAADPAAEQQAWMEAMKLGEHHEHLKALAGNFDYTMKSWMDPSQPPMESTGKRTSELIMGGRYLVEKYSGNFMGMPFEGQGTVGYDNIKKQYVTTWIDNMSTGIFTSTGQCEKASSPTWTFTGEMPEPSGKMMKSRTVVKVADADHYVMEMFATGPDGKEFKMMEISHARTK